MMLRDIKPTDRNAEKPSQGFRTEAEVSGEAAQDAESATGGALSHDIKRDGGKKRSKNYIEKTMAGLGI